MENMNDAAVASPQPTLPVKDVVPERSVVIDTGAIVKGETKSFHSYASRFFTCQEVLQEVRDSKSRDILASLPFELEIRTPSDKAMQIVYNFAKKTGDFAALSLCDLKIIALTYDLELEAHQQTFLREAPQRISHAIPPKPANQTIQKPSQKVVVADQPCGCDEQDYIIKEEDRAPGLASLSLSLSLVSSPLTLSSLQILNSFMTLLTALEQSLSKRVCSSMIAQAVWSLWMEVSKMTHIELQSC
jgi:hypothetical protein